MHGSRLSIVRPPGGRVHLVTGATGFVGGALVLELLERTGDEVVAVVRPGRGDVRARLFEGLLHAARAYGSPLDTAEIADRCRAVEGDVLEDGCGLDAARVGPVDQLWHSAASLRYENRYRERDRGHERRRHPERARGRRAARCRGVQLREHRVRLRAARRV